MTLPNQPQQLRISGDYRNHLLVQIELLRCAISHEELSARLGDVTERCLARYIAGKTHLRADEFRKIAEALSIDAQMLAQAWAASLGVRPLEKDPVSRIIDRAYRHWRLHSRLAARRVPPNPSPMTVVRAKYADRLPRQTPNLWFHSFGETKPTREGRQKFGRAYEMLVEFVHSHHSQREVGAMHGLSGARAAQLMRRAAYTWAESEGIDLIDDKSMPFKVDRKLVKNLYGGLRFFAQQQFDAVSSQVDRDRCNEEATR